MAELDCCFSAGLVLFGGLIAGFFTEIIGLSGQLKSVAYLSISIFTTFVRGLFSHAPLTAAAQEESAKESSERKLRESRGRERESSRVSFMASSVLRDGIFVFTPSAA